MAQTQAQSSKRRGLARISKRDVVSSVIEQRENVLASTISRDLTTTIGVAVLIDRDRTQTVELQEFSGHADILSVAWTSNLDASPWINASIHRRLLFRLFSESIGGDAASSEWEGAMSVIETTFAQLFANSLIRSIESTFQDLIPSPLRDLRIRFTTGDDIPLNEQNVVRLPLILSISENTGSIAISFGMSFLNELFDSHKSSNSRYSAALWRNTLQDRLFSTRVDLETSIHVSGYMLSDISRFKKGDMIRIDIDTLNRTCLSVNRHRVFVACLGRDNDHFTVRVSQ